jgi:predicted membrane metal-binding protein
VVSLVTLSDNPFAPLIQGPAIAAVIVAMLVLMGALIVAGLRRDNRLRWGRIAAITGVVLIAYLVGYAVVSVLTSGGDGFLVALSSLFLFVSPATLIICVAAVVATWAYFASLRWQARNADTKQYLADGD